MKPSRLLFFLFVSGIICTMSSCRKDSNAVDKTFVTYLDSDSDLITRSCFQLSDGSFIIAGTGEEYAMMSKFSETGDFIWKKRLPGKLFGLKKGIALPAGGFIIAGADSLINQFGSNENGITTLIAYDNNGNETDNVSISGSPYTNAVIQLDLILLSNGNLALCLCPRPNLSNYSYPRLVILDQHFSTLFDQVYYVSQGVPYSILNAPRIQESWNGDIYCCFQNNINSATLIKLKDDYSMDFNTDSTGLGSSELPGSFTIDGNGNCCIATARQVNPGQGRFVYYHPNENYSYGNEVSVLRTDASGNYIDRHDYTGFPPTGSLMKIIRTSDGGFVMTGTSNQRETFSVLSNTQIFLIRTDAQLNRQWMRQFNATYPAVGYDVIETRDGGFAIGAFERSFNKNFKMMIIKTDANGR